MNFEFRFQTDSNDVMELQEVTVDGFDEQGQLLFELPLNNFGLVPPVLIIHERKIEPGHDGNFILNLHDDHFFAESSVLR